MSVGAEQEVVGEEIESAALMIRDDAAFTAEMAKKAFRLKDAALEQSALIGRVSNQNELDRSVIAQTVINDLLRNIERARVACKEIALKFCQNIDEAPRVIVAELEDEAARLAKLNGDFSALENSKAKAAQAAQMEALSKIEREREEKIAVAKSVDEQGAIREEYAQRQAALPRMSYAPIRAEGQKLKDDWEYEITNGIALAMAYPSCVDIKGRATEIKAMLNNGIELPGVVAKRVMRSGTKSARQQKTLNV